MAPRRSPHLQLPDFPWDTIADARARAAAHPGGIVDLSVGTPVDPTPAAARAALTAAADSHGYPTVWGTPQLRQAIIDYLAGRWGAQGLTETGVLPVIGTKELVAALPAQLGLGAGDTVVFPAAAYPTYQVGAVMAGCTPLATDDPEAARAAAPSLIWLNSPANPHGAILSADELRRWVEVARDIGAILASDECYGEFGWDAEPVSVLHPDVCGGSHEGLLVLMSESKRSNLAGYRAGFVAGDEAVVADLLALRKHLGMMVPAPVQAAMAASLADADGVTEQRERYLRRREVLVEAVTRAGLTIDHSEGSLYLWLTRGSSSRELLAELAELGILVAPGDFYGDDTHVRMALTATDERIEAAARRLMGTV
ncbi:succinyldiaminopimelate transaminase [Parenemella sanctibonifatiensis]|uniref:Succinyldiaminopimelate transaminase n=1 Tax=Parenemella sanctibonifatiensis TaxID=2016505 RepID=A0A255E2X0_9ACTN|nr:succinyldiaminopimelate transaminase [Parenemella sanctibonifatiensis]OYN85927.1 succinyldiaminopimelate transaminase [Parenemella sanctibonifatiensis]